MAVLGFGVLSGLVTIGAVDAGGTVLFTIIELDASGLGILERSETFVIVDADADDVVVLPVFFFFTVGGISLDSDVRRVKSPLVESSSTLSSRRCC